MSKAGLLNWLREKLRRRPVCCLSGIRHKGGVSLTEALLGNVRTCGPDAKGEIQVGSPHEGESTDAGHRGGVARSSEEGPVMGLERRGHIVRFHLSGQPGKGRSCVSEAKSFAIERVLVWEAYERVRKNKGAAGVDGQSLKEYGERLEDNLYKLWNRMSSGSYFPPAVRVVEIPKSSGGKRALGIPTVGDRIAQMVVKMVLEPLVEPHFHPDSYGYRPGKSALGAVCVARERCWERDWVVDIDIRGFFDNLDHELLLRAVTRHTEERWVLLYVDRWLKAPAELPDGTVVPREKGTPQGGVISPLLSNIFLHYALDEWLRRYYPDVLFERYADDVLIHCRSEAEAQETLSAIGKRLDECHLQLNPQKSKIVYCKDQGRRGDWPNRSFDFLGYSFRPRKAKNRWGQFFIGFNPAVSDSAVKKIREKVRKWRLPSRVTLSIEELAEALNPTLRGWVNYYARFRPSALSKALQTLNFALKKWAIRKYKRFRRSYRRAQHWLMRVRRQQPVLFAHWQTGSSSGTGR